MSCYRFFFLTLLHPSFLPSFPLSLSLFFFPCIPPSLDPLLRHTLPTDVRCTGQNPETLPRSSSPRGNQRKSTLWRLPGSKFFDSLCKGAFWSMRLWGRCPFFKGGVSFQACRVRSTASWDLAGPSWAAQPSLLPVPEATFWAEKRQCWLWNDGPEKGTSCSGLSPLVWEPGRLWTKLQIRSQPEMVGETQVFFLQRELRWIKRQWRWSISETEGQEPSLRPSILQMDFKHVFCDVSHSVLPSFFILCLFLLLFLGAFWQWSQ